MHKKMSGRRLFSPLWLTGALIVLGILFFYHLDFTALQSYDEAWYAEITRTIVRTHQPFLLSFNGSPFTDHPPLGFWLMVVPTLIWGSNEFSVRAASALMGVGSVILLYLAGTKLKNKQVGLSAAAILLSCLWFMLRARSGNLDVPFLFWSLATFYGALNWAKNQRGSYATTISFAALFLTKTVVGVGILPVIIFAWWVNRKKTSLSLLLKNIALALALISPWYLINAMTDHSFLYHHFVVIGARGAENSYSFGALAKTLLYLHSGIGKWYSVFGIASAVAVALALTNKTSRQALTFIGLYFLGFFAPFAFATKTEIWHLIPVYPAIALLISYVLVIVWEKVTLRYRQLFSLITVAGIISLAAFQFRQSSNLIYQREPQFSAEKDISLKAAPYPSVYLLDTFYPAAVYYSQRQVIPLHWDAHAYQKLVALLQENNGSVFIINDNLRVLLESDRIPFTTRAENQSYYLISQ